jgi:hypothetical protein
VDTNALYFGDNLKVLQERLPDGTYRLLPATLFGDDPAGFGGDVTAALHGDAAA